MLIVIIGVTGVGKTTIGRLVAHELGVPFYDADDFHSQENRQKMTAAVPLSERDRKPWLRSLARRIPGWEAAGGAVLACSALRKQHREILQEASDDSAVFVFLDASPETIRARLAQRHDHFMSPSLLNSQLGTLEAPTTKEAVRVDADGAASEVARAVLSALNASPK